MKLSNTRPTATTPKPPTKPSPFGLGFANLASLPTRLAPAAKPATAATATKRPATTAKPARPAPVKASKPAPVSFAHLSGVRLAGPILTPIGPKPTASKADRAAVDASWDEAFRRANGKAPTARPGRDDAESQWDRLLRAAAPRRPE
jgi:hypothetical protein